MPGHTQGGYRDPYIHPGDTHPGVLHPPYTLPCCTPRPASLSHRAVLASLPCCPSSFVRQMESEVVTVLNSSEQKPDPGRREAHLVRAGEQQRRECQSYSSRGDYQQFCQECQKDVNPRLRQVKKSGACFYSPRLRTEVMLFPLMFTSRNVTISDSFDRNVEKRPENREG